jgi:hypothetical protein
MSWSEWFCDNINGKIALNEVKLNNNPQSVYWIEQNTVYFNPASIETDENRNRSSITNCSAFNYVYDLALNYVIEHSTTSNYIVPGFSPIG